MTVNTFNKHYCTVGEATANQIQHNPIYLPPTINEINEIISTL